MKILYKISIALFAIALLASCKTDEPVPVNPDFKVSLPQAEDGSYTAVVGQWFHVTLVGSGEFLTLFEGTEGRIYGDSAATGTDFNSADSLPVRYGSPGSYKLTVLSSSTSGYGKDISRTAKTVIINAVDKRNTFTSFSIKGPDGVTYTGDIGRDSIIFKIPVSITDFNFKPVFTVNSSLAKVYVNNVEQASGTTSNNFTGPVEYVVKSSQGDEKKYFVKFYTYPLSAENQLFRFALQAPNPAVNYSASNGEEGVIDQVNKTITLAVNYGTNASGLVRYNIAASPNSTIFLNQTQYTPFIAGRGVRLDLLTTVTVRAQNGTDNVYSLIQTNQDPFTRFTFKGLTPQPVGVIDHTNKTITVSVLQGTPITNLVAEWVGTSGKVVVKGVDQKNGVTANDFTSPVVYQVYKGATLAVSYTVSLNVIQ